MIREKNKKYAFPLIELLVSIGLFITTIGVIFNVFLFGIRQQRIMLNREIATGQTSFVLEYLGRALRMAKKDTSGSCLSRPGLNYEIPSPGRLKFINVLEEDDCQEIFLDDNQLKIYKSGEGKTYELTSPKIEVSYLNFSLSGENQTDKLQPRVTISFEIKEKSGSSLKIQTSISQRNLDI
ncbi:MAG TPA: hypothetical protein ENL27_01300 [Candidatus Parcubacteria bacterium]|nr:hypothetical protein [Candidatus Parcubacteria bacterium]